MAIGRAVGGLTFAVPSSQARHARVHGRQDEHMQLTRRRNVAALATALTGRVRDRAYAAKSYYANSPNGGPLFGKTRNQWLDNFLRQYVTALALCLRTATDASRRRPTITCAFVAYLISIRSRSLPRFPPHPAAFSESRSFLISGPGLVLTPVALPSPTRVTLFPDLCGKPWISPKDGYSSTHFYFGDILCSALS